MRGPLPDPLPKRLCSDSARAQGIEAPDVEEEMRLSFSIFDKDGDGFISPKEMTSALSNFGITLTARETELLIAEATLTSGGDKRISFEVFKKVMTSC